jgi:DegV family protein with EDD domain
MAVKCGIVVDSTFDLPLDFYRKHNIKMVPLRVIFSEDEVYREHIELSPEEFYTKLNSSSKIPTTSQPPSFEFLEVYNELLNDNDFVLSLHLPQELSGTMQSAQTAANELGGEIYIKSTYSVSVGSAQILKEIVEAKERFDDKKTFLEFVDDLVQRQFLLGILPTLYYLEKGGRIGKAQVLLGSLLDFKPLLAVKDGVVVPLGRARGMKKAFREITDHILNFAQGSRIRLLFGYGEKPDQTEAFRTFLKEEGIDFEDGGIQQIGPVIGTYLGPEVVMVSVLKF